MTIEEIKAKLEAEGITPKKFIRNLFPNDSRQIFGGTQLPWLGEVKIVSYEHNPQTKHELENERIVYHLPEHGLYLRSSGVKEKPDDEPSSKRKWDYWEFLKPCSPEKRELGTETIYI